MLGDELKALLDLEYREWMTKITAIFRGRDKRMDELRRESFNRANPESALNLWARPVRLEALRKAVQSRLQLRTEYAQRQPELLSQEALSTLRADLERFVENAVEGDQRSLPEAGDIIADLRVGIDKLALDRPTPRSVQAVTGLATKSPVFISYSWDSGPHKEWVLALATKLRAEGGIDVILDQWHLELGARSTEFMERAVRDSGCVLVICTEGYKNRFDNRAGGAGYEGHIITGEIINEVGKNKFIPILRHGNWKTALPTALAGVHGVDFSNDSATEYQRLLNHLLGVKEIPPVGVRPNKVRSTVATGPSQSSIPKVPITLVLRATGRSVDMFVPADQLLSTLLPTVMKEVGLDLHEDADTYIKYWFEDLQTGRPLPPNKTLCELGYPRSIMLQERRLRLGIGFGGKKKKCFHPNTRVLMASGAERAIGALESGELVLAWDPVKRLLLKSTVVARLCGQSHRLVSVNGSLLASASQTILTAEGWKTFRELKVGDRLVEPKQDHWVEVRSVDIREGESSIINLLLDSVHTFIAGGVHRGGPNWIGPRRSYRQTGISMTIADCRTFQGHPVPTRAPRCRTS